MKCLNCKEEMINTCVITKQGEISYDMCETCGSFWLDPGVLNKMALQVKGNIEYCSKDETQDTIESIKKCIKCEDTALKKVFFIGCSDIILDYCSNCGGFWLDGGELGLINKELKEIMPIEGKGLAEFLSSVHIPYWYKRIRKKSEKLSEKTGVLPLKQAQLKKQTTYKCPACRANLNEYAIYGINIEGCPQCKGIWTDKDELRKLKDRSEKHSWGTLRWMDNETEAIEDVIGMNSKRYCPKCDNRKLLSVSFGDSLVIIDWCPSCHGIWLDKEEFTEIKDYLRTKLDSLSSTEMRDKVSEEIKEIWSGPEGNVSEMLDAKAAAHALINTTIFEQPKLAKVLLEISRMLNSAGF